MRVPVYEPDVGLTRLETVRVSRANADQRRGRAGRTEPGVCYRLWEEAANGGLQPYAAPEILSADLSGLALDCALWGVADPSTLTFLDPPPRAALKEARGLLTTIGAIDGDGRITEEGRAIASLALPPRLARMVVDAARAGDGRIASEIAVVLTERGLGGDAVDLTTRVEAFRRDRSQRADDARRLARGLAARAKAALIRPSATFSRGEKGALPSPDSPSRDGRSSERPTGRGVGGEGSIGAPARLGLPRPHRNRPRKARRIPHGQRPGGGAGSAQSVGWRAILSDRRNRRARRFGAHPPGCRAHTRGHRTDRRQRDRKRGRTELRPRVRVLAGSPPSPARRDRPRRADARRPAERRRRVGAGARRSFHWCCAAAVDERSQAASGPGDVSGAKPRASCGPTCRTKLWPPTPAGSRLSSSAKRSSTRSAPMSLRARSTRCCPGTCRGGSPKKRQHISRRPPEPKRRSTTKPRAARRSRSAFRSCSGSTSIRRWPAGAFRSPSICSRPPTVPSRSRATCPAFGEAPGPPSAPTFAAAIHVISGPRTPLPPFRRRGRSRGGGEPYAISLASRFGATSR